MIKTKVLTYTALSLLALSNAALAQGSLAETQSALAAGGTLQGGSAASGSAMQKSAAEKIQEKNQSEDTAFDALSNSKARTDDGISTSEAIDQIQKTLLFSDEAAAKRIGTERKSSLVIDRVSKSSKPLVEVLIEDNRLSKTSEQLNQKQKLAYNASMSGQYEVAIELYKQILRSDPNNNYASFALAACYHKLGQYKQAKTMYYQLLKKEWADEQTKNDLIGNLIEVIVEESPNEAIYLLNKLSAESPESAYIMAGTAMAYDKINKPDQAILLLKRAINIDPKEVRYKFNLAVIYDKTSDYQNAAMYYQAVISNYITSKNPDTSLPIEQIKQRFDFIKDKI